MDGGRKASDLDLGRMWRTEKLRDFEWRLRCMGLQDAPEARQLLASMADCTADLNALGDRVSRGELETKWWCDGEYDRARAEAANDAGAACFKSKAYGEAFDRFTEAIRLYPSRAVYHCNRAGAALKIARHDVALADAMEAARLDPASARAWSRCAAAHEARGCPGDAAQAWAKACDAAPGDARAKRGLARAREAQARVAAQEATDAASTSDAGGRPLLPIAWRNPTSDPAAWHNALVAASDTARHAAAAGAGPPAPRVALAHAEALVMCRRYSDALTLLSSLGLTTWDATVLRSEALWRSGDVTGAREAIASHVARCGGIPAPASATELDVRLRGIASRMAKASALLVSGCSGAALKAYESILPTGADAACCSGLHAAAATGVGEAALALAAGGGPDAIARMRSAALPALDSALALEPEHVGCLSVRAEMRAAASDDVGAMADLAALQQLGEGSAFARMREVASRMLGGKGKGPSASRGRAGRQGATGGEEAMAAMACLGVKEDDSDAAVRKAYRKLAAQWHPDKWVRAEGKAQQEAESRFREIQRAYETLMPS